MQRALEIEMLMVRGTIYYTCMQAKVIAIRNRLKKSEG